MTLNHFPASAEIGFSNSPSRGLARNRAAEAMTWTVATTNDDRPSNLKKVEWLACVDMGIADNLAPPIKFGGDLMTEGVGCVADRQVADIP